MINENRSPMITKQNLASLNEDQIKTLFHAKALEHFEMRGIEPSQQEFEQYMKKKFEMHGIQLREPEKIVPQTTNEKLFGG